MFEKPDSILIPFVTKGDFLPPEFWKLNEAKTDFILKSEEEILADDWNENIERRCEYFDYLQIKVEEMEKYLKDTDWYSSRKIETGKDIPENVLETRKNYRIKISDFRQKLERKNESE